MSGPKEQFLLYRIRQFQDRQAFAELIREYASGLNRVLHSKLPSSEDAEDAYNATLLRTWNYLTGGVVESVGGLIHTIARGVVADFYRERKIETVSLTTNEGQMEIPDVESATEILRSAEHRLVKEALARLKDDYRDVLVLRYMEGLSTKEIAERMQSTDGSIRMLIHRALKALQTELDPQDPSPKTPRV